MKTTYTFVEGAENMAVEIVLCCVQCLPDPKSLDK